ncbi:aldehyde dehydrogenase family protein [Mycobacterium angelicum]|uniref:Aldehyde dehydrogenase n=1 Tax=Mycobacterium angelicum TaxID=470074 RepID=A0A1W9ZT96_MYCAN|nr:aldehyde dehydrogenase family protein [Mycobacterium angelicum]MCV7200370.1 aldehyde dehydrogenase [Mycobacterium angelicum]ORA20868.1 aldehyde dehydrogenase [Mycobacterium angelicum]
MRQIEAIGPDGPYRAQRREPVCYLSGEPLAELSMVPPIFAIQAVKKLRRASRLSHEQRLDAMRSATASFAHGCIDGMSARDYQRTVSKVTGTPIASVQIAVDGIEAAGMNLGWTSQQARPAAAVNDWRDPAAGFGSAVWTRRGDVFAVLSSGNTPAIHSAWFDAVAYGYRVVLRPSRREPFTPFRLVSAMHEAGLGDYVAFLPCGYDVADKLVELADVAMIYGGQSIVHRYGGNDRVLVQGPGRSKVLIGSDAAWQDAVDTVAHAATVSGGASCMCTTSVLVEGDPRSFATALAAKLSQIPSLSPEDPDAILTVRPCESARRIERCLRTAAEGATPVLGGDGVVDELPDGGAVLRPAVHLVDSWRAPQLGIELPFPCVWVGPWDRSAGVTPLRNSLVVVANTGDTELVDELLNEPSIRNVYVGDHPTTFSATGLPHDGYLGDFLMRTKASVNS